METGWREGDRKGEKRERKREGREGEDSCNISGNLALGFFY